LAGGEKKSGKVPRTEAKSVVKKGRDHKSLGGYKPFIRHGQKGGPGPAPAPAHESIGWRKSHLVKGGGGISKTRVEGRAGHEPVKNSHSLKEKTGERNHIYLVAVHRTFKCSRMEKEEKSRKG